MFILFYLIAWLFIDKWLNYLFIFSLPKSESDLALKSLIQCCSKATSVDIIKQILDCLSVEKFHPEVLTNEVKICMFCDHKYLH